MTADRTGPPRSIPSELLEEYTMSGRIPVLDWYIDESAPALCHNTGETYEETISLLSQGKFAYYGVHVLQFEDALKDHDLCGRDVLIWGLAGCNCEAMALWKKARKVYVVDYNKPRCDHEDIVVLSHEELEHSDLQVDFAFSFSSFEHDGLGRYGDPLSPSADLKAMEKAKKYLKPNGTLFFGVPTGRDALVWNAHRIYGPLRFPLILKGWLPLGVYSVYPGPDIFGEELGTHFHQPLLALQAWPEAEVPQKELLAQLVKAHKQAKLGDTGTRNSTIMAQLLEFQLQAG